MMRVELRVVASAELAASPDPDSVNDTVAVVAVVMAVVALTVEPRAVERDEVRALVSAAVVLASAARLALPLGVTMTTNVST